MNKTYCQSCGMPLYTIKEYGTDKNGIQIEDYCQYCFKDGKFTSDVMMEEMIQLCAKYMKDIPQETAIAHLRQKLPHLKRWAQKEDTQNQYHKSINKVLDYIDEHLGENPDLETLSGIANISTFHFHRIFKAIIGENLGKYIKRIRLEYVASKLRSSEYTLSSLAEKTGYNSEQALSKAFKKHFGMPPSTFKFTSGQWVKKNNSQLSPRLCKISNKHIIYIRIIDNYGAPESYSDAWKKLYIYTVLHGWYSNESESLGISFDDPSITVGEKCRFYACVSVEEKVKTSGIFASKTIDGGLYAIFTLKGAYSGLTELYKEIWFSWFPESKYRLRKGIFFEKYLNNPHQVKEEDILTEIYIPVREK